MTPAHTTRRLSEDIGNPLLGFLIAFNVCIVTQK